MGEKVSQRHHVSCNALTGYGCFKYSLHRIKLSSDTACLYFQYPEDTVEHTIFDCAYWDPLRLPVRRLLVTEKLLREMFRICCAGPPMSRPTRTTDYSLPPNAPSALLRHGWKQIKLQGTWLEDSWGRRKSQFIGSRSDWLSPHTLNRVEDRGTFLKWFLFISSINIFIL